MTNMGEQTSNYQGDATIIQDDKRIAVVCDYRAETERIYVGPEETVPGMRSWQGTLATHQSLNLGNATLELPDGSTGNVIIRGIETVDVKQFGDTWQGALLGSRYDFVGTGPEPLRSDR